MMKESLEHALSKQFKEDAVNFLHEHPEAFEETIRISLTDIPKKCWRAAWLINTCMEENDLRVVPFIDSILSVLPDKNDGHQRELIKILERLSLSEDQEGILYHHCIFLWGSVRLKPSLRHIAFKVMARISKKYPELKQEIIALTQPQYIYPLSPGIRNSVRTLIQQIKQS